MTRRTEGIRSAQDALQPLETAGHHGCFAGMMVDGLALGENGALDHHDRCDYLKAHRTASSLQVKKDPCRLIGRTKDGMNTKLHAVTDRNGRPLSFFMTAGQVSDYSGGRSSSRHPAEGAMAAGGSRLRRRLWFRDALQARGIKPCIPRQKSRARPVTYDRRRYKHRNRIEIMFGRLKDWRRVATRYGRCPTVFFSAICLAATVMFWL